MYQNDPNHVPYSVLPTGYLDRRFAEKYWQCNPNHVPYSVHPDKQRNVIILADTPHPFPGWAQGADHLTDVQGIRYEFLAEALRAKGALAIVVKGNGDTTDTYLSVPVGPDAWLDVWLPSDGFVREMRRTEPSFDTGWLLTNRQGFKKRLARTANRYEVAAEILSYDVLVAEYRQVKMSWPPKVYAPFVLHDSPHVVMKEV
jgi:hypothetical protein